MRSTSKWGPTLHKPAFGINVKKGVSWEGLFEPRYLSIDEEPAFKGVKEALSLLEKPAKLNHSALYVKCKEGNFGEAAPFWCALADVLETPRRDHNQMELRPRPRAGSTSSAGTVTQDSACEVSQLVTSTINTIRSISKESSFSPGTESLASLRHHSKDRQIEIAQEREKDEVSTVRMLVAFLDLVTNLYKVEKGMAEKEEKELREELENELENELGKKLGGGEGVELGKELGKEFGKKSEDSTPNWALEWEYVHCSTSKIAGLGSSDRKYRSNAFSIGFAVLQKEFTSRNDGSLILRQPDATGVWKRLEKDFPLVVLEVGWIFPRHYY